MRKTAFTFFGALLISGLAVQMATASERHARKAHFDRVYDRSDLRRAYNLWDGPIAVTPELPDRSWVGGKDPTLSPSGS